MDRTGTRWLGWVPFGGRGHTRAWLGGRVGLGPLLLATALAAAVPSAQGAAFDVWYRPGPEGRWTLYGGRTTRDAADREAADLKRMAGYETKVTAQGEPRPDLVGVETPLRRSTAVRGTTYVARPGLGYAAGWARHWGGWSGWGGGGWGGGWGGGYGGGAGGYSGSWSHHHHSSHHHSHEHHSSHSGDHPTAHPSHTPRAGGRGAVGHSAASHHSHSHSHSHTHSSHQSHSHGGHRR